MARLHSLPNDALPYNRAPLAVPSAAPDTRPVRNEPGPLQSMDGTTRKMRGSVDVRQRGRQVWNPKQPAELTETPRSRRERHWNRVDPQFELSLVALRTSPL